jgi:predicted  nucleic acid-binding Zn-ribbon protein
LNNLNELINGDQEANNLYTSLAELRSKAEEFVSKLDISARDKEAEVEHLARTTEQELLQLFTSSFDRSFHPSRSLKNAVSFTTISSDTNVV